MLWCILLENKGQYHQYTALIERQDALTIIERNFERGELTRDIYKKLSLYLWQYKDVKIHLVPQSKLKDFIHESAND